jgi:hypothetical protein
VLVQYGSPAPSPSPLPQSEFFLLFLEPLLLCLVKSINREVWKTHHAAWCCGEGAGGGLTRTSGFFDLLSIATESRDGGNGETSPRKQKIPRGPIGLGSCRWVREGHLQVHNMG